MRNTCSDSHSFSTIYGRTNGSKEPQANAATYAMLQDINTDARGTRHQPHGIIVDLHGLPDDFATLQDFMGTALIHVVGAMPTKAGERVGAPTCSVARSEGGNSIDFMLSATQTLDMIK